MHRDIRQSLSFASLLHGHCCYHGLGNNWQLIVLAMLTLFQAKILADIASQDSKGNKVHKTSGSLTHITSLHQHCLQLVT